MNRSGPPGTPGASARAKQHDIVALQMLRAIAAMAVVWHHIIRGLSPVAKLRPSQGADSTLHNILNFGAIGVDIFFILSGFLMIYIAAPYLERRRSIGDFLAHRLVRIWPAYAVVTLYILAPIAGRYVVHGGELPFDLRPERLASLLFWPSFDQNGFTHPILGVGWTLNYEMLFYLCFSISLLLRRHLLVCLATLIAATFAIGNLLPEDWALAAFLSDAVMFEFLIGALIATAYMRRRMVMPSPWLWLALAVMLCLLAAPMPGGEWRLLTRGIPAGAIFIAMLLVDRRVKAWPKFAILLGNASYSIYLVHTLVIYKVISAVQGRIADDMLANISAFVAATIAATLIGLGFHLIIEKSLLTWGRKLTISSA